MDLMGQALNYLYQEWVGQTIRLNLVFGLLIFIQKKEV